MNRNAPRSDGALMSWRAQTGDFPRRWVSLRAWRILLQQRRCCFYTKREENESLWRSNSLCLGGFLCSSLHRLQSQQRWKQRQGLCGRHTFISVCSSPESLVPRCLNAAPRAFTGHQERFVGTKFAASYTHCTSGRSVPYLTSELELIFDCSDKNYSILNNKHMRIY